VWVNYDNGLNDGLLLELNVLFKRQQIDFS